MRRLPVRVYGFFPWGGPPPPENLPVGLSWTQATPSAGLAEWRCWCGASGHGLSIFAQRVVFWCHRRRCRPLRSPTDSGS